MSIAAVCAALLGASTAQGQWAFEEVHSGRLVLDMGLALDSRGRPFVAYGGESLHLARGDGAGWSFEDVDVAACRYMAPSIALDFGAIHIYQGGTGVASTAFAGLMLGALYLITRRDPWTVILVHGLMDTIALTIVYLCGPSRSRQPCRT